MSRLIYVATICVIFAATGAQSLNVRKLDEVTIKPALTYDPSYDLHKNTFGLKAQRQDGQGMATVDTGHFESGPQHLVTSEFKCETYDDTDDKCSDRQFYDNVQFDSARCVELNNAAQPDGTGHVVGYKNDDDDSIYILSCPVSEYCDTWESLGDDKGAFAQTDYCYDLMAPEVIDNLLCKARKDTSGQDPAKLAHTGSTNHKLDWCTTSSYSTRSTSNPASGFDQTMFQIEDYDILDQQCYTLANSDKDEFTDVVCTEANHEKENGQVKKFLENLDAALTMRTDADDTVAAWRHAAESRYPNQEYCMNTTTLLTELFGCADDQRVACTGDAYGKECAGNLDSTMVAEHEDYLDWDPTNMKNNYYGNSADQNYRCTVPEIAIANALSSYLDKADLDITTVCDQAKTRFRLAYTAYVDFVDPNKFGDDNLYTVLRAAWRQAEFTLRSAKIQQQTLDRMRKYQDLVESNFADAEQGLASAPDVDAVTGYANPLTLNDNYLTASEAFRSFRDAWDSHVQDYIDLSHDETNALVADLQAAKNQIDNAKQYAQEIAATQISAASALASVSVHFRKKLKLWMQIEDVLETKLKEAFTVQGLNIDGDNQEHAFSNMATTEQHTPLESSFTIKKAVIGEGEDYNGAKDDVVQDRNDENIDIAFTNAYDGVNDDRLVEITMSDGQIMTTETCNTASDCDKFKYESATNPQQDRIPECQLHYGSNTKRCVLPRSSVGASVSGQQLDYSNNPVVKHEITASMAGTAGATSNDIHGSNSGSAYNGDTTSDSDDVAVGDRSAPSISRVVGTSSIDGDSNSDLSSPSCSTLTIHDCIDKGNKFNVAVLNGAHCLDNDCTTDKSKNHCCAYTPIVVSSQLTEGDFEDCDAVTATKTRTIERNIIVPAQNNRGILLTIDDVDNHAEAPTAQVGTIEQTGDHTWVETATCAVGCQLKDLTCDSSTNCIVKALYDYDQSIERESDVTLWRNELHNPDHPLFEIEGNTFQMNGGASCTDVIDALHSLVDDQDHHCLGCHEATGKPQLSYSRTNSDRGVNPADDGSTVRSSDIIEVKYFGVIQDEDFPDGANQGYNNEVKLVAPSGVTYVSDLCGPKNTDTNACSGAYGKSSGWCINQDINNPCIIGKKYEVDSRTTVETVQFKIQDSANRDITNGVDENGNDIVLDTTVSVELNPRVCGQGYPDATSSIGNEHMELDTDGECVCPDDPGYGTCDLTVCGSPDMVNYRCPDANGACVNDADNDNVCDEVDPCPQDADGTKSEIWYQDTNEDGIADNNIQIMKCLTPDDTTGLTQTPRVEGCMSSAACNFKSTANIDDGSCVFATGCQTCSGANDGTGTVVDNDSDDDGVCNNDEIAGCQDSSACNFNADATDSDNSCTYPAQYYDCNNNCLADTDGDGVCDELEVLGCTDSTAFNYRADATEEDGSCVPVVLGCIDQNADNYHAGANTDDGTCEYSCNLCTL